MGKESYFPQPSSALSQGHFSNIPHADIERSRFDRSHGHKTSFNAGQCIPVYLDEVLPGDTFDMDMTAMGRLTTLLKPIMDNVYLDTHFFFVPHRLVWVNWNQHMGENMTGAGAAVAVSMPTMVVDMTAMLDTWVMSHFGIPYSPAVQRSVTVCSLPWRAYVCIWNEWYRDQNFQAPINFNFNTNGPDAPNDIEKSCLFRYKRKDYFTSCLPWPQKGSPVYIPTSTQAPVVGNGIPFQIQGVGNNGLRTVQFTFPAAAKSLAYSGASDASGQDAKWSTVAASSGLVADLSAATAVTINDLRTSFQIQKLLERDARGGTRYTEIVLSHFGVQSDDSRQQRPEYLGGGTQMIAVNPVATTSQNAASSSIVASLGANANVVARAGFRKSFTEHGYVIGIMSIRADMSYQQGVEKLFLRRTRLDHYWPSLSHLGEQAVTNAELFVQGNASDSLVFGYQERYAEYRYKPSRITGIMNSTHPTAIDVWHLGQEFAALPVLNNAFLAENPPIARVTVLSSEPQFAVDCWFKLICDRPMPVYSVPGLIDHF